MLRFQNSKHFEILRVSDLKTFGIEGFNGLRIKVLRFEDSRFLKVITARALPSHFPSILRFRRL